LPSTAGIELVNHALIAGISCALLFVGMVLATLLGHRLGRRYVRTHDESVPGVGAVEAAVFALLGLLTAFTFSGAYTRFDARRQLITQEANAIGTAYRRLDLLAESERAALRALFIKYLDSRASFFVKLADPPAALAELARATSLQNDIWRKVVTSTGGEANLGPRLLLLPALNNMIDITTTREIAVQSHPPLTIFMMLFGMAIGCAALTGYGMARIPQPSLVHTLGFAAATSLIFYIILDMEYPRSGFIRLDAANQLLFEMRDKLAHSE
jgi:hypothetical protein